MKHNIFSTLLIAGALGAMMTSCDDVAPDNRYHEVASVTPQRGVLLEDFTGQNCLNCPDAHEVIEKLEEQWGDKLIAVSIHCGGFGFSTQYTDFSQGRVGLMTEEGQEIMDSYGITQWPMGVINMGSPCSFELWGTEVMKAIAQPTNVTIEAGAVFTADAKEGSKGTISIHADVTSTIAQNAAIQFWMVEDNIVARQKKGPDMINDYVHNNVFRAMLYDMSGHPVHLTPGVTTSVDTSIECRWTDKEHWEASNLSVVAFVFGGGLGVQEVVKCKVE